MLRFHKAQLMKDLPERVRLAQSWTTCCNALANDMLCTYRRVDEDASGAGTALAHTVTTKST